MHNIHDTSVKILLKNYFYLIYTIINYVSKNAQFQIINQHMNIMCQINSLENKVE
jgi:hypothetical protein